MKKKRTEIINAKRDRILETAGRMFVHHGYKSVTMDGIAEAVPVSKATLYNHFKDKEDLFQAVIVRRCLSLTSILERNLDANEDPVKVLTGIAKQFLKLVLSPDAVNMHRIMIAEANEFPELGKMFYQSGPLRSHTLVADYLSKLKKAGKWHIPDPELSAAMFFSMLKGRMHAECLLGLKKTINPKEQNRLVAYAVNLFIQAHRL